MDQREGVNPLGHDSQYFIIIIIITLYSVAP